MNIGHKTFIYFISRILAAFIGFLSTIYFARVLGAEALGIYALVLSVVSWLSIVADLGITGAVRKRVSEGTEKVAYAFAAASLIGVLSLVLSGTVILFSESINGYIGYPAAISVLMILVTKIAFKFISALFEGQRLVHLSGVLTTIVTGFRSIFQVGLILIFGLSVSGLLLGYAMSYLLVSAVALILAKRTFQTHSVPDISHLRSIVDYAKFSWIGGLRGRTFNWLDITVLGFFVTPSLIGIYSVAWTISRFLFLFSSSISRSLFPEISEVSANQNTEAVSDFLELALSYAGLLLLPGLAGGFVLSENILRIYSPEFKKGASILVILLLANLIQAYQSQLVNTLNAIDRPDLSFKINFLFIIFNLVLNVALVYLYGWIGAAVATTTAIGLTLVIGYVVLSRVIEFSAPLGEIGRQGVAAAVMGVCLYEVVWFRSLYPIVSDGLAFTLAAIAFGAIIYFSTLWTLSAQFRQAIADNFPTLFPCDARI